MVLLSNGLVSFGWKPHPVRSPVASGYGAHSLCGMESFGSYTDNAVCLLFICQVLKEVRGFPHLSLSIRTISQL